MSVIEEIEALILRDKAGEENRYWQLLKEGVDLYIIPIANMKFDDMVIMGFRATKIKNGLSNFNHWTLSPYLITLKQKWPIVIQHVNGVYGQTGYKITLDPDRIREWNLQNLLGAN